jgi:hypothetical protein
MLAKIGKGDDYDRNFIINLLLFAAITINEMQSREYGVIYGLE